MDTLTTMTSSWDAPNSDYDRDNTANELSVGLVISSVQTADSGDYICSASVTDSSDSEYVVDSATTTAMVNIIVSKLLATVRKKNIICAYSSSVYVNLTLRIFVLSF